MEVYSLSSSSIRIKGKQASVVIDPTKNLKTKVQGDGVLLLSKSQEFDASKVEEHRVIIQGSGEFELGGLKISGTFIAGDILYELLVDELKVCIAQAKTLSMYDDKNEYHVVIINANGPVDASRITKLTPSVVVLYGEHGQQVAKQLGKESPMVSKYQITFEKLPPEMEVVTLG